MKEVIIKYLKAFGKYFLFVIFVNFLLALISFTVNKGGDINSSSMAADSTSVFTLIDLVVILVYLSIFNYRTAKEIGLKSFIGLIPWLILILPVLLYNYLGRTSLEYLIYEIASRYIIIAISGLFIFAGNLRKKKNEREFAMDHNI